LSAAPPLPILAGPTFGSLRVTSLETLAPRLRAGLTELGLPADPLAERLLAYLALLLQWNRAYNLTAIREPDEMIAKHLLDSLSIHSHVSGSLADIGTGPGLPGIPLALADPDLSVSLVETAGKKARFLREAVRHLGLARVRVFDSRAQDVPESGQHDCLAARAFGTLEEILAAGGHLLKSKGRLLAMKGRVPAEEIAALPNGFRHLATHRLAVPGLDAERHLVVVEKL
jgi:16S rRNA (guanine527-N7)-methyltransferase